MLPSSVSLCFAIKCLRRNNGGFFVIYLVLHSELKSLGFEEFFNPVHWNFHFRIYLRSSSTANDCIACSYSLLDLLQNHLRRAEPLMIIDDGGYRNIHKPPLSKASIDSEMHHQNEVRLLAPICLLRGRAAMAAFS